MNLYDCDKRPEIILIRPVALSCFNGAEKKNDANAKTQAEFIYTKFLEELRQRVPVAQVLKEIERCSVRVRCKNK